MSNRLSHGPETQVLRCWLRLGGHDVEVRAGETLIGRHEDCDLVLDDALASRRHAKVRFDGGKLMVVDLGSVNGVIVNGARIEQTTRLASGDQLRLGNTKITVHLGSDVPSRARVGAQTLVGASLAHADDAEEESTVVRDGEALSTLAMVAEKVLAMGRGVEAERILQQALRRLRERVGQGERIERETLETAALYAVRLAEVTGKGRWIDYVFELYIALGSVLPGPVIDRLYSAVRSVGAVNLDRLRVYIGVLQGKQSLFGPSDLFLLRRIEGLERLIGLR